MSQHTLTIALISDVFHQEDGHARLSARLKDAKAQGARLAVLPEIAVLPWSPATSELRDHDAEATDGPRHSMLARLAAETEIGLLGGLIERTTSGRRFNTCVLFDSQGIPIHRYRKVHIPDEPGFHECDHYDAGEEPPSPVDAFGWSMGVQICSDMNRPAGSQLLAAQGCECILGPRSTEEATYWKWRPVFIANALTCCAYVLSVNRPGPEQGVLIGGPSIAVAPTGEVLLETTDPIGLVTLDRKVLEEARRGYPGYLAVPSSLYARGWATIPPRAAHESRD
ncbi:MAG: carbon-nitrogen hydrolase family protein [Phycisphaerales bacterium]|nr:carbon-nitrogen hydrolase family protein [Phycisphaerales bacterium]